MYNDQMEVTVLWRGASSVPLDGSKQRGRESPFMRYNFKLFVAMLFALIPGIVSAGTTDVIKAKVSCQSDSTCQFTVTLSHADIGWDHYADRWEVLSLEGEVLGTRILYPPMWTSSPLRGRWPAFAFPRQQNRSAFVLETRSMVMVARRSSWTFHSEL